jgi:hypothetical protein
MADLGNYDECVTLTAGADNSSGSWSFRGRYALPALAVLQSKRVSLSPTTEHPATGQPSEERVSVHFPSSKLDLRFVRYGGKKLRKPQYGEMSPYTASFEVVGHFNVVSGLSH